jgi:hypothetical protein
MINDKSKTGLHSLGKVSMKDKNVVSTLICGLLRSFPSLIAQRDMKRNRLEPFQIMTITLLFLSLCTALHSIEIGDLAPNLYYSEWLNGKPIKSITSLGSKAYLVAFWSSDHSASSRVASRLNKMSSRYNTAGLSIISCISNPKNDLPYTISPSHMLCIDNSGNETTIRYYGEDLYPSPYFYLFNSDGILLWKGYSLYIADQTIQCYLNDWITTEDVMYLHNKIDVLRNAYFSPNVKGDYNGTVLNNLSDFYSKRLKKYSIRLNLLILFYLLNNSEQNIPFLIKIWENIDYTSTDSRSNIYIQVFRHTDLISPLFELDRFMSSNQATYYQYSREYLNFAATMSLSRAAKLLVRCYDYLGCEKAKNEIFYTINLMSQPGYNMIF